MGYIFKALQKFAFNKNLNYLKHLKEYSMIQSKQDKQIIERYLSSNLIEFEKQHHDVYIEGVYKNQAHKISRMVSKLIKRLLTVFVRW